MLMFLSVVSMILARIKQVIQLITENEIYEKES